MNVSPVRASCSRYPATPFIIHDGSFHLVATGPMPDFYPSCYWLKIDVAAEIELAFAHSCGSLNPFNLFNSSGS